MIHELKQAPVYFEAVLTGEKLFEVRKNDRNFRKGDMLALNEYDEMSGYTGRSCLVYVDYVLNDENYCKDGYVVMSIKPCIVWRRTTPEDHNMLTIENYSVPLATGKEELEGEM